MEWLAWLLPLASGALDASSRGIIKTTKVHKFTMIAAGFFFALPFYAVWLIFAGMPQIKDGFWAPVGIHILLFTFANILIVEAHRTSPLILTMPYVALTPAFLLVVSPAMEWLGCRGLGHPTWFGVLGVLFMTAGVYVLNTQSNQMSVWAPFRALIKEEGSWKMLLVAVIFSVTSNLDLIALQNSNAPFYLLVDHGLTGVIAAVLAVFYSLLRRTGRDPVSPAGYLRPLAFYGCVIAVSVMAHMWALGLIPTVPYVIAGKRAGSIIFAIALGLWMAFVMRHQDFRKERDNLQYRIPGVLLMIAGMLVIIFWGKA
jgi:hypothetical protein